MGLLVTVTLQWYVVAAGLIVVLGNAAGVLLGVDAAAQLGQVQRLFVISGLVTMGQVRFGHRLPILAGPSAILLAGLALAPRGGGPAVFSAIVVFGALVALLAGVGVHARIRPWFTSSVAAVVLLLVGASLVPVVLRLASPGDGGPGLGALVALGVLLASLAGQRWFPRALRGAALPASMVLGVLLVLALFPGAVPAPPSMGVFGAIVPPAPIFAFDAGIWVTIGCCYIGLVGNDIGALAAMAPMRRAGAALDRGRGPRAGLWTGAANLVSGLSGVIGPVNYALSAGVVQGTGCARRAPLLAAGGLLVLTGLLGGAVAFAVQLPAPVIAGALGVIVVGQLQAARGVTQGLDRRRLRAVLLPVALGVGVMAIPGPWLQELPSPTRALLGNGFLVGLVCAILMRSPEGSRG